MQQLRYSVYLKGTTVLVDVLLLLGFMVAYFGLPRRVQAGFPFVAEEPLLFLILMAGVWLLLSGRTRIYDMPRSIPYTSYLQRILTHELFFAFVFLLIGKLMKMEEVGAVWGKYYFIGLLSAAVLVVRSGLFFFLKRIRSYGINHRNVMFLGEMDDSLDILAETIHHRRDYGFKIYPYPDEGKDLQVLALFWKKNGIDSVFVSSEMPGYTSEERRRLMRTAEEHKVKVNLVPRLSRSELFQYQLHYIETVPYLSPTKFPLDYLTNYFLKRAFDVVFSLLFLLFIGLWLFPVIALLIRIDSRGPIFFRQKRYGFREEVFECIKFRTMVPNAQAMNRTTAPDDPRITAVGQFLRRTSLDELPQFFNVLKGEMSVVGPRPHMLAVDDYYRSQIRSYGFRSGVFPGITGLAQVNGLRGDAGDMRIEMKKRFLADSFYIKNWSFVMDCVIIGKTIWLIITGDKKAY